ncbi:MAG: alpha-ketoacid dehydrogenase subunit beta [Desulfobacteraceae bacterium]|nr:alpha-ketoacid dehydrogenase subunit beta [Desulfobacteraceae bacterium]
MTENIISCAKALSEALHEEMARDERVFLIGEDITAHGGNFGQFGGLYERFGERVIDTPISETAIAGAGVGAALTGMRPVVDLYFADFLPVAMDEIVNQTAKMRYMFGGQVNLPLVIWVNDGGGVGAGAHHSQCLESWFVHTPGLKVVVPSEPADVKGLMKAAIRDEDPVMFFQHKLLFAQKGPVPEGEYVVPLGKGEIKRHGKDITILTYSRMTYVALDAAKRLAEEGIDSEIVDLRTLKPLDFDLIAESVKKTKHVLVAHEACLTGGFGAEVAARIGEEVFDYLDAPVTRIGAKDTPIPVSPILENFVLPQVDDIVSGARRVLNL